MKVRYVRDKPTHGRWDLVKFYSQDKLLGWLLKTVDSTPSGYVLCHIVADVFDHMEDSYDKLREGVFEINQATKNLSHEQIIIKLQKFDLACRARAAARVSRASTE